MPKKEISVFTSNEIRKQFLNNYEKKKEDGTSST